MLNRTIFSALLGLIALALALPGAALAAGSHGGAVVFSRVVTTTVREATTVEGGLFAVRDGRLNQLTEDPTDTEPAFSADGRTIAFVRGGDIYAMRADGSGQRAVTGGAEIDSRPIFAADGRFIVFERRAAAGSPRDLYMVGARSGNLRALVQSPADDHSVTYRPRGHMIVFVRSDSTTSDDLYSVHLSGTALRRLTRTGRIDEFMPRFFAGGVLFSRGESSEGAVAYADVYTMRFDRTRLESLVAGAGSAYVEDVTRDGRTLLFRRDQGLWVKRIGAGAARKLTELPDNSQTNGVFSSDGKKVAAFIEADGREQLTSIDVRSGSETQLAEGFVPSETTDTGGTTTTIGPVITWQPTR
jgi:Tol biopolymer transport system component